MGTVPIFPGLGNWGLSPFLRLGKFRDESAPDTWSYRILVRQTQHYLRWRALRELWTPPVGNGEEAAEAVATTERAPVLKSRIAAVLGRLSAPQRQALRRELADLGREIAR